MDAVNNTYQQNHLAVRLRVSVLLKTVLGAIFSFEMSFVLFMFATVFKKDPRLEWIPMDITQLLYGLNLVCGLILLAKRWLSIRGRAAMLIVIGGMFCFYAVSSTLWSLGQIYAAYKAELMIASVLWTIVVSAAIISSDQKRLKRLFVLLVAFALWISVESLSQFIAALLRGTILQGIEALGAVYLTLSRSVSIGMVIVLGYILYFAKSKHAQWIMGSLFVAFFIVLALLGGRTPLIGLLVAALVPLFLRWRLPATPEKLLRYYLLIISVVALLGIGLFVYTQRTGTLPGTLERLFGEGRLEQSSSLRLEFYSHALSLWVNEGPVFGTGIGSWPILEGEGDIVSYPHNILLEVAVELGTIGLALLLAYWLFALFCLGPPARVRGDPFRVILLMLFINALINALFSYDLPANRWLFSVCALMAYGAWVSLREQHAPLRNEHDKNTELEAVT